MKGNAMNNISFSPPNILIVDDVNANLVVLSEIIRSSGYIARPVTSATQAVSAIDSLIPNLILLDISMPEIDGFVFCSMLKKNASTRDIPIIFISALNSKEDKMKGFRLGAVDYISKPFEVEEVTMRINTHLRMHKIQQELEIYNKKLYKIINDQIKKIYEEQKNLINALAKICTVRDGSIKVHMERVGHNSRIVAMSLQLSAKYRGTITNSFIDTIEQAAYLHDIGKITISDTIMLSTDNLNSKENETIKSHTTIGAEILEDIYSLNVQNDFIKMAIEIAKYHHEEWAGTGYPSGISGTAIPLSARIVAVVDAYDMLINSKTSFSHEVSMDTINNGSGTKFDPEIVAVFNKIQSQLKK
jgi:putative two-component system response regulator